MTKDFINILRFFNNAIRNSIPVASIPCNITKILSVAKSQGIWDCVFLTIKPLVKEKLDEEMYRGLNRFFITHYGEQQVRYALFHEIVKKIHQTGISCCILKGESVSCYYPNPYVRISSDIDVLVNSKEVLKIKEILLNNGFSQIDSCEELHHISFIHPQIGLVELHTEMYSEIDNNIAMDNLIKYEEAWVDFITEDGTTMKTLGYTDNFIFLFVHFLKHFFRRGVAIRQLTDILLYVENEYSNIDWDRVNDLLNKLSFRCFFLHLIAIGERYFEFPKDLFDTSSVKDELIEKILTDIEKGGVWGRKEKERKGFAAVFFQKRYEKLHPESKEEIRVNGKKKLFPNRAFMSINYKYVEKSELLMPVAWVHRVWDVLVRRKRSKPVHDERLELLRELDII